MQPEQSTPDSEAPVGRFKLNQLAIRKAIFEEVARDAVESDTERPSQLVIGIEIGAKIEINPAAVQAQVTLNVEIKPDRKWQPYRIVVVVSGVFAGENVPLELFEQFCRVGVPPILFPYVRQMVHQLTVDAAYGVVRLDPVNLADMLNQSPWSVEAQQPATVASELSQP